MKTSKILIIIILITCFCFFIYCLNNFSAKEGFDASKFNVNTADLDTLDPKNIDVDAKTYKQIIYAIILKKTQNACYRMNIPVFLSSGTCLGYFREGKIIDHDYDIDVGIWSEDYNETLIEEMRKEGLIHYRTYGSPDLGMELSFRYPGTLLGRNAKIDIFLHYLEKDEEGNNKVFWISYAPFKKNKKRIKYRVDAFNLKKANFLGMEYHVPYPTLNYIKQHYGDDWMIPKKPGKYLYYKSPKSIVKN